MEVAPSSHHQQQQEGDFPIPMSSSTKHGEDHEGNEHHLVNVPHHHHDDHDDRHPHDRATQKETEVPEEEESCRHRYKYRECMKNHAAALGGNARDGCGEFIPSGTGEEQEEEEEEQQDSLICSACACHRNFHRKELLFVLPHEHPPQFDHHHHHHNSFNKTPSRSRNFILGYPAARAAAVLPMIMSSHNRLHHVRAGAGGGGVPGPASGSASAKKRIRTKFSQEQREKMLNFAERVGWKIQKQEDCVVQRFCQEIGVKRRVLKVWMHNNKHNLAKKK